MEEELEKAVGKLQLTSLAKDALLSLCRRSYQSPDSIFTASTAVDSREGKRLVPELLRVGYKKVTEALGYDILTKDGSLHVTPIVKKEATAA
jgi:hypothetical protein